jgi:hypothetical protein
VHPHQPGTPGHRSQHRYVAPSFSSTFRRLCRSKCEVDISVRSDLAGRRSPVFRRVGGWRRASSLRQSRGPNRAESTLVSDRPVRASGGVERTCRRNHLLQCGLPSIASAGVPGSRPARRLQFRETVWLRARNFFATPPHWYVRLPAVFSPHVLLSRTAPDRSRSRRHAEQQPAASRCAS